MKKMTNIAGQVIPLDLNDVDTDLIIPAQYLTSVSKEGFGQHCFQRLKDSDPDFAFNQPRYQGANILVSGDNFGCGSSREHAVWALQGAGIEAIIAPRFADIFASNSAKNGLLLISLEPDLVTQLMTQAEQASIHLMIDIAAENIQWPDGRLLPFSIDPFCKHCFINGLDELDYLLAHREQIAAFRQQQPVFK